MIFPLFPAAMTQCVSSQGRSGLNLAEKFPEAQTYEIKREPRNNNNQFFISIVSVRKSWPRSKDYGMRQLLKVQPLLSNFI